MFSHCVSDGGAIMIVSALCKGAGAPEGGIDADVSSWENRSWFDATYPHKFSDAASIGDDVSEVFFDERVDFACSAPCLCGWFKRVV